MKVYTIQEVAEMLRVSVSTVRGWRYTGQIQVVQLPGGSLRVTETEVERIMSNLAVPAGA